MITPALRAQLFAEAAAALDKGEPHWLVDEDLIEYARGVAREHVKQSAYAETIGDWLALNKKDPSDTVKISEILKSALDVQDVSKWKSMEQGVASTLKLLGWENRLTWSASESKPVRAWIKKDLTKEQRGY